MKTLITGSRTFSDYDQFKKLIRKHKPNLKVIMSGNQEGVDILARRYASEIGVPYVGVDIDVKDPIPRYSERCQHIIAFWDGKSRNTRNVILYSKQIGRRVKVHMV